MVVEVRGGICDACGRESLRPFADLGGIPVLCGVHWPDPASATASPSGRMVLGYCPSCAYVRNLAFDPSMMVYDTTMDTNLHHSPAFQAFSADLVEHLAQRYDLAGKRVLDIGCGQGEFLRELCHIAGCGGVGYDAMYVGPTQPAPATNSDPIFHSTQAPRGADLPDFDLVTSRHWIEHLADPHDFLVDLRQRAGGRPVRGYFEVPDACYDLATAGWEVIYPHISYFDAYSLCRLVERAGWQVEDTGTLFSGMFRFIEISANGTSPRTATTPLPNTSHRDRQLAAIAGFSDRHHAQRISWQRRLAHLADSGARPALWGAGSRAVQFLTFADRDHRLASVVDLNPRKWERYLPITAHRVDPPASLAAVSPKTVIITNPAYRSEVSEALAGMGIEAELLIA